jgi:Bacterial protein of unknown function (DUF937)
MNLVDAIKEQMPGGLNDRLSQLIGGDEGSTKAAVGAAVPALLQALSGISSRGGGAAKLASVLGGFASGSPDNIGGMLTANPGALQDQGSSLLNSLLGGGMVSGLSNSVGRFAGLGSGAVTKLLGYLMPLVLGGIAGRVGGKALNAQSLTSLFADQRANIANALPSGLSLSDVPGFAATAPATPARAATYEKPATYERPAATYERPGAYEKPATYDARDSGASLKKWLFPLLGLAALALAALMLWPRASVPVATAPAAAVPSLSAVTATLTDSYRGLSDTFSGITDSTSASRAVDRLRSINTNLDGLKASVDRMPAEGKTAVTDFMRNNLGKLEDQYARLLWIPGVADKIKPLGSQALDKMAALGGLPPPRMAQTSAELAGAYNSLNETLGSINSPATADAALPKLTDISANLDTAKSRIDALPDTGQSSVRSLMKSAMPKLTESFNRVLGTPGISDSAKSVINGIMDKLTGLAG